MAEISPLRSSPEAVPGTCKYEFEVFLFCFLFVFDFIGDLLVAIKESNKYSSNMHHYYISQLVRAL